MNIISEKDYEVLFITGVNSYDDMKNKKFPSNVKLIPYLDDLTRIMKKTDLIISRAGASTLSEIIALQIPAILIPSPYVPNNHQYKNAVSLEKTKAAIVIEEKNLNSDILINTIDSVLNNDVKANSMKKALKDISVTDSATKIYRLIKEKCRL